MADYYPIISRAVSKLASNTGEARQALYERVRAAFDAKAQERDSPLSETEIKSERAALETAIGKVEAELQKTANATKYFGATLKSFGEILLGIAFIVGLALAAAFYIRGLWVSEHVAEYLTWLIPIAIMLCFFILLPLAIFRKSFP